MCVLALCGAQRPNLQHPSDSVMQTIHVSTQITVKYNSIIIAMIMHIKLRYQPWNLLSGAR